MSKQRARQLRRDVTEAEKRLWARLRDRRVAGARFRRQTPIGPYIVDFVCFDHRLLVEVDGGQHAWEVGKDAARTRWLEGRGLRVLRFWNNAVLGNTDGVVEMIGRALKERGSPCMAEGSGASS